MADKPKVRLFTFRTFPTDLLHEYFPDDAVVLGKLKQDIKHLHNSLVSSPDTLLLGVAIGSSTRQESVALNNFNQKKILRDGPDEISLKIQHNWNIPVTSRGTFTFCNYAMYSLALNHPVGFVHITKEDVPKVSMLIKELCNR